MLLIGPHQRRLTHRSGCLREMHLVWPLSQIEAHKARGTKKLPFNMLDAIREFKRDKYLGATMGEEFTNAYIKLRNREWDQFTHHLTQWERDQTLDC